MSALASEYVKPTLWKLSPVSMRDELSLLSFHLLQGKSGYTGSCHGAADPRRKSSH